MGWQQITPEPDPEWTPVGNVRGPEGPPGPPGSQGPVGQTGNEPDIQDLTTLFENGLI